MSYKGVKLLQQQTHTHTHKPLAVMDGSTTQDYPDPLRRLVQVSHSQSFGVRGSTHNEHYDVLRSVQTIGTNNKYYMTIRSVSTAWKVIAGPTL